MRISDVEIVIVFLYLVDQGIDFFGFIESLPLFNAFPSKLSKKEIAAVTFVIK